MAAHARGIAALQACKARKRAGGASAGGGNGLGKGAAQQENRDLTQIGTAARVALLRAFRATRQGAFGAGLLSVGLMVCLGGGALAQGSPSLFDARRDGVLPPGAIRPPEDVAGDVAAETPGVGDVVVAPELSFGPAPETPEMPEVPAKQAATPPAEGTAPDIPSAAPADAEGVIADMPADAAQDSTPADAPAPQGTPVTRAPTNRPLPRPQGAPDPVDPDPAAKSPAAQPPRPEGCADPAKSRDADVARNAARIDGAGLCLQETGIREHGRNWRFTRIGTAAPKGSTILLLDDSDDATFDLSLAAATQGATLIAVETGEARILDGQNPARNFGATPRATANCTGMAPAPSPLFAQAIADLIPQGPILAFAAPDPDLSAARTTDRRRGTLAPGGAADPHSLVLTADLTAQAADLPNLVAALSAQGLNTVHLRLDPPGGCTLLDHAVLTKLGRPLILHAGPSGRAQMLDAVLKALRSLK